MSNVQQQARFKLKYLLQPGEQLVTGRIFNLAGLNGWQVRLGKTDAIADLVQSQI